MIKSNFLVHDLRNPLQSNNEYNQNQKFDVVVSTEVAEHIDPDYADIYISNLKELMADDARLIISWAEPPIYKQHLNPKTNDEFFSYMEEMGFVKQEELTNQIVKSWLHTKPQKCPAGSYIRGGVSVWKLRKNI